MTKLLKLSIQFIFVYCVEINLIKKGIKFISGMLDVCKINQTKTGLDSSIFFFLIFIFIQCCVIYRRETVECEKPRFCIRDGGRLFSVCDSHI